MNSPRESASLSSLVGSPSTAPAVAPKSQILIDVSGDRRLVDLYVPELRAAEKAPLLIALHANGETPSAMEKQSGVDELAVREEVIVALPPASNRRWRAQQGAGAVEASPDITYIAGLIRQLIATQPVDPARVYVTGWSMGGALTDRVACELADLVTAVAIDAGAPWSEVCDPARPVSVLVIHGTADNTFSIDAAHLLAERWRRVDGCPPFDEATPIGEHATSVHAGPCEAATAVTFVTVQGGAHRWFTDPSATELAWQFLDAHPRP